MNSQRKILAVVRNPVGGIRAYMKYTYGTLDPARYRFTIVTRRTSESQRLRTDLSALPAEIVEVDGAPELTDRVMKETRSGHHDLIHSHGLRSAVYASPGVWVQSLLPFVQPVPHVVTSHDVFLPHEFKGAKGLSMKIGLTFVLNRAAIVHSVSQGADDNLSKHLPGLRKDTRRVVMNGIPPVANDNVEEARVWRADMAPHGETLFGFFGRFMPQKGFEHVIAAADRLQKRADTRDRFRVIAVSEGGYLRERRSDIDRLGLTDRFVFIGSSAHPRPLMERIDAVLMPSLWEACGLVAMEALWAGTPLISTDVHGLADVTAGSPAIIVKPADPESLAAAMTDVIRNRDERRAAARAYSDAARRRFDVSFAAAGLQSIFDEALSQNELGK